MFEDDDSIDGETEEKGISMDSISEEKVQVDENGNPTLGATVISSEPFTPDEVGSEPTKKRPQVKIIQEETVQKEVISKPSVEERKTISQSLGFAKTEPRKELGLGSVKILFYDDSVVKTVMTHGTEDSKTILVEELKAEIRRRTDESLDDIVNKYIEDIKSR